MKKILAFAAVFASIATFGANNGSCESAAVSLKIGKPTAVSLTREYDPDENEYDTSGLGVYYFKQTLTRGMAYTLAVSGVGASEESADGYSRSETDSEFDREIYAPSAAFMSAGEYDGVYVYYLEADDWDSSDPSSWLYYFCLSGNEGETVSVTLSAGIVEYAEKGSEENPAKISFSDSVRTISGEFIDGEYNITTSSSLKSGRLYRVRTEGGTDAYPISLSVEPVGSDVDFETFDDTDYSSDTNNTAMIVAPATSGNFSFVVSGGGASFTLNYQSIPERSISNHQSTLLDDTNGYSTSFVPGRIISSYDYADDIIDEHLASIVLAKGERWVFTTEGATVDSEMRLYDAKGNVLATNTTDGYGYDLAIGYEVTKNGTYYIGVCEPALGVGDEPTGAEVTLLATKVETMDGYPDEWDPDDDDVAGAVPLSPLPASLDNSPFVSGSANGPHRLSETDWSDCFQIGARKGLTYVLGANMTGDETADLTLKAEVFTLSGSREVPVQASGSIDPFAEDYLSFEATANATYYIRVSVAEGAGLKYPEYTVYSLAYDPDGAELGILQGVTKGAEGTWTLDKESVKYANGVSILVAAGGHTVNFTRVAGFSQPASEAVTVVAGAETTVATGVYSDAFDPNDDTEKGATSWTLKNTSTSLARTLWEDDEIDHFAFTAKDGQYFTIALEDVTGDAVFSITNAELGVIAENVTSIEKVPLATTKAKYILSVTHGEEEAQGGSYTLSGYYAQVGAIQFAKTAVSVKENAANVSLSVKRTAKDGVVRVKYGTVAGTAEPGVDYVAQNGILEWADGDNTAKTITVKLIPDLVAEYEGDGKTFSVRLEALDEEDLGSDEYPAMISGGDTATVTLTEVSKAGTTAEDTYAKTYVKGASVKTEQVPLYTGTFNGILAEDGFSLTNNFPKLASITFTASVKDALSAKVALGGKTYNFKATAWDEKDETSGTYAVLEQVQKVAGVAYTNTLTIALAGGTTTNAAEWASAGGTAELVMNVPDANNKGVQEGITYTGALYRDNSKVQDFLDAVTNYAGYYTIALSPTGLSAADGIPAGNGYLTLTIDNKGKVKVAGQLPDGKTKPSVSVVSALVEDTLYIPVYFAKKPSCFGGVVKIVLKEDEGITGVRSATVVSSEPLFWYSEDATLSYDGEAGFEIEYEPVGGWYDKVANLQTYYLTSELSVSATGVAEFPSEALASGYEWITDDGSEADGYAISVSGDAFATEKQKLVKDSVSKLYDFSASTNAANVQVKVARATGLVSGSFVAWSTNGKTQKSTNLKHQGVLLFNRDEGASADPEIATFGYFTIPNLKVTYEDEDTGRTKTRAWTFSAPFNVLGQDQGDIDWWAEDWGEIDGE